MKDLLDRAIYVFIRGAIALLTVIPHPARVRIFATLLQLFLRCSPRYQGICHRNLDQVFPDLSPNERQAILTKSTESIGRLISDSLRLPYLNLEWCHKNITIAPSLQKLMNTPHPRGVLFVSGHIGSFEIMAHFMGTVGHPLNAVARTFKNPYLEAYFKKVRTSSGNRIIARKGASKEIVTTLGEGQKVALLFDQNVTRKHAVFVDWFGRTAATTFAPALAIIRSRCEVVVTSIVFRDDKYIVNLDYCDFQAILDDIHSDEQEKIRQITQKLSTNLCKHILDYPEGWFWMHRRWKTTPEGVEEDFYN